MEQWLNDTFPTPMHIAAVMELEEHLLPHAEALAATIEAKANGWVHMIKTGRTHLMDAVPLTATRPSIQRKYCNLPFALDIERQLQQCLPGQDQHSRADLCVAAGAGRAPRDPAGQAHCDAMANLFKLGANVLTATTLECMGAVLALLRKGGVDRHVAYDVLTSSLFDSRVHKTYGEKIIDERYNPPGMAAQLAIKDLRLALSEAERTAVPMPAASLVHDRLVGMVARWWAELDWSALGLLAAVDAGLNDSR
jgi:hypothetical protein